MATMKLPAKFDRQSCLELLPALSSAVASGQPIEIDASDVERVGQSGLQLIVAAAASAERRGNCLTVISASAPFLESAQRAALGSWVEERS